MSNSSTPWTATLQAPLSSTVSLSLLKPTSLESVMLLNHLNLCHPLLLLPSTFPSISIFHNELALCISFGASAAVLPMNSQCRFPLKLVGLILPFKDSQEPFLAPQFKNISSSMLSLLNGTTLTSIESTMPSNHLNLCHPLLLLPSILPSIRV